MAKFYPKAIPGEQQWVDYDEETESWGVFGLSSGHCYSTHSTEEQAEASLDKQKIADRLVSR